MALSEVAIRRSLASYALDVHLLSDELFEPLQVLRILALPFGESILFRFVVLCGVNEPVEEQMTLTYESQQNVPDHHGQQIGAARIARLFRHNASGVGFSISDAVDFVVHHIGDGLEVVGNLVEILEG